MTTPIAILSIVSVAMLLTAICMTPWSVMAMVGCYGIAVAAIATARKSGK